MCWLLPRSSGRPCNTTLRFPQTAGNGVIIYEWSAGCVRVSAANQARIELNAILRPLTQTYAKGYDSSGGPPDGMVINRLQDDLTRAVKPALLAILGAVGLVLLIVCVNVTNLVLALGARRRSEFAMRAALGAGRMRMIRQVLTESLLLAAIGGALGLAVAVVGVRALVALSPPGLPRVGAIHIDGAVFAFGLVITTVIGLIVGLLPALQASRSDPHSGLQQSSRTTAGGRQSTRRALAVSQVALALVLLVTAGLVLRSLQRLFAIDPGFDASHLLTMQVQQYGHQFDTDSARARFLTQALEAVGQVGGVTSAAFTSQLPLSGDFDVYGVQFEVANRHCRRRPPLCREPGLLRNRPYPAPARPLPRPTRQRTYARGGRDQRISCAKQIPPSGSNRSAGSRRPHTPATQSCPGTRSSASWVT